MLSSNQASLLKRKDLYHCAKVLRTNWEQFCLHTQLAVRTLELVLVVTDDDVSLEVFQGVELLGAEVALVQDQVTLLDRRSRLRWCCSRFR